MLKEALVEIFERDLNKLKDEVNLYTDESKLWIVKAEISNSAGNLCQHLLGNLNHFVGALIGNSGYERDRPSEFNSKNASRSDLIEDIEKTIDVVKSSLNGISNEDFEKNFPVQKHEETVKTDFMLLHLLTHFNYHLGQINYHRRLLQNDGEK